MPDSGGEQLGGERSDEPRDEATGESKFCSACGEEIGLDFTFCPRCGARTPTADASPGWREVMASARQAASPYVQEALDKSHQVLDDRKVKKEKARAASSEAPESAASTSSARQVLTFESNEEAKKPPMSERIGRSVGSTAGYTIRSGVGVGAEPVVDKVWNERPDLPTWQKIVALPGWALLLFQPVGWVILGATFITMVMQGRHNVHTWAAWITEVSAWLVVALAGIAVLGGLIALAADSS